MPTLLPFRSTTTVEASAENAITDVSINSNTRRRIKSVKWIVLYLCWSLLSTTLCIAYYFGNQRLLFSNKNSNESSAKKKKEVAPVHPGFSSLLYSDHQDYLKSLYDGKKRTLKTIGLIHIGKCGGVSARRTLENSTNTNSVVKRGIRHYHMMAPLPQHVDLLNDWILIIRNPIERIQSNWVFSHPDNTPYRRDGLQYTHTQGKLYRHCYPTFDDAAKGIITTTTSRGDVCPQLVREVLYGRKNDFFDAQLVHFYRNYHYYLNVLLNDNNNVNVDDKKKKKRIYVVRTEHMLNDLNAVNRAFSSSSLFGKKKDAFTKIDTFHHFWDKETNHPVPTSQLPYNNRTLSKEGLQNLCWILCEEIQLYIRVLRLAKNLNPAQVQEDMDRLIQQCPEHANDDANDEHFLVCDTARMLHNTNWIKDGIPASSITAGDGSSETTTAAATAVVGRQLV